MPDRPDTQTIREALESFRLILMAGGFRVGPESVSDSLAALDRLEADLARKDEALRLLIEKAEQYLDTGRGDLDGAIAFARAALAAGTADGPKSWSEVCPSCKGYPGYDTCTCPGAAEDTTALTEPGLVTKSWGSSPGSVSAVGSSEETA